MMGGTSAASIAGTLFLTRFLHANRQPRRSKTLRQSQAHTSATLAAQAASSATVSVSWTRSQGVWRIVLMAGNIRRFWQESLGDSFSPDLPLVRDSDTSASPTENGPKRAIRPLAAS